MARTRTTYYPVIHHDKGVTHAMHTKAISNYIDSKTTFFDIQRREQIIKFLDTKIKTYYK
jgi:hypothetical protein